MNNLIVVSENVLPVNDRNIIENQIEKIIQQHKNNRVAINEMTFDCVAALTAGKNRSRELSNRGFFKRLWGGLTGSNRRLQNEINENFATAQFAAQNCLQKLAEQNLMTFELIGAVNNKLNSAMVSVGKEINGLNREINEVYEVLTAFFKENRSEILRMDQRLDKVERNVNLLNWQASIEFQTFSGKEYSELSKVGKIVCLTKDFFEITKGEWTTSNLLLFKSALNEVELSPKNKISYLEFLEGLATEPKLLEKFLEDVELEEINEKYLMILSAIKKFRALESAEKYQINNIAKIERYISQTMQENMRTEVAIFDFCLEILYNFSQFKFCKQINDEIKSVFEMGENYFYGRGVEVSYQKACEFYFKAAEKNYPPAQYHLGVGHLYGLGVEEDYNLAVTLFCIAAENGYEPAKKKLNELRISY